MRSSTLMSLAIAILLAGVAVFATRTYLADQQARLAAVGAPRVEERTLVVAAKPMRFGDRVMPESLKTIPWPSAERPDGSFQTIEAVVGDETKPRYAMEAIDPGEPVLTSKITGAGERATLSAALDPGKKAISIRVNDVLGVAGFVRPSDRVDVLLTRVVRNQVKNSDETFVDVLLQGVKVLAVDQTADERKDEPSVVKTVTFEVTTPEAQRLTLGANIGTLSLALRNIASASVEDTRRLSMADLGGGLIADELAKNDDGRFDTIEKLVQRVGDELGTRIDSVEDKMKQPVKEKQLQIVERKVEPDLPIQPKWATVGVWNTTKREEHRVGLIQ